MYYSYEKLEEINGPIKVRRYYVDGVLREIYYYARNGEKVRMELYKDGQLTLFRETIDNISYWAKLKNGVKIASSETVETSDGKPLISKEWGKDGELLTTDTFKYNDDGLLVEAKIESAYNTGIHTCEYDSNNYLIKKIERDILSMSLVKTELFEYSNDKEVSKLYDQNGQLKNLLFEQFENDLIIREISFSRPETNKHSPSDEEVLKEYFEIMEEFKIDINGNSIPVETNILFLDYNKEFVYDEFENLIKETEYTYYQGYPFLHKEIREEHEYKYDKNGKLIEKTFMEREYTYVNKYEYDDEGRLIYDGGNKLEYNDRNLLQSVFRKNKGIYEKEEIEYDEFGNITKYSERRYLGWKGDDESLMKKVHVFEYEYYD